MTLRRQNRAVDLGRGLLALIGIAGLVVGVPAALLAWVGSPLPSAVPALSEVTSALRDTYIPDEFLVKVLALVCWLAWIELVASLLVEAVAYARGRKAGAVPLAGGLQRGAARLIATVALLGAVMATKGMPEPAGGSAEPLAAMPQPALALVVDEQLHADELPEAEAAPAPAAPTYEVQRRDTLWDIAERHLGDPFRWQEIYQLNEGCPQADGRCLSDPDLIFAGWQLQLPGDAIGLAPPPAPEPAPAPTSPPEQTSPSGPGQSSVVIDGGMVLIDDGGAPAVGGDVLLAADESPGGRADGMVLLPDGSGAGRQVSDEPAVLAGPPAPAEGRRSSAGADDEIAAGADAPAPAPARPADD